MPKPQPYVFPANADLIGEVKNRLKAYLLDGSETHSIIGLAGVGDVNSSDFQGLRFLKREGTNRPGDNPVYEKAQVIFMDDALPGVPCVKITMAAANDVPVVQSGTIMTPLRIRLECTALGAEGAVTPGIDAKSAEDALASYVRKMCVGTSAFRALRDIGLRRATITNDDEASKDELFRNPLILEFKVVEEDK